MGADTAKIAIEHVGASNVEEQVVVDRGRPSITEMGNVGIGTNAPSATLHVNGTALANLFTSYTTTVSIGTTATTLYNITSGQNGLIYVITQNAVSSSSKYMGWFEWTTGSTAATLMQISVPPGNQLSVTISSTTIQGSISSGPMNFSVRVILM